jgi:hypothetical protein
MDFDKRMRFCHLFLTDVHDGLVDPKLAFFTDEANFNLTGYVH